MIFGTYFKIDVFWHSPQVHQVRQWFGDRGARIFYYSLGSAIMAFGLFISTQ